MAEDVDPNLIRQTKEALSKHIKKPPLHDKFLKKPPFRFLQDIVKSVVKETKFLDKKFSDEDFETAKDRDSKVKFLDKLVAEVEAATGKKPTARPAKIVAGLDVNKTLELLILLGQAVDKTSNSKSRRPSSDKTQEEKKPAKAAEKDRKDEDKKAATKTSEPASKDSARKTADRPQSAKGRSRTVLKTNQPTENKEKRKSTASQKPQSKKEEVRKSSPAKKKPEKVSSRTKEEPPQVDSKKVESEQKDASITEDVKTKNKNEDSQIEPVASSERESETKNQTTDQNDKDAQESTETQDKNPGTTEKTAKKQEPEVKRPADNTKETKKTMDSVKETKKAVDSVKEHKKPVDNLKEVKKPAENAKTLNKSSELAAKETSNKAPEKPKIPSTFDKVSDSGRVTSAIGQRQEVNQKSGAALMKDSIPMKRVFTPEKSAKQRGETEKPVNIFTESQDGKDDADDMFMPETQYVAPTNNQSADNKGDFREQGQLVSQIIDTKKQLESKDGETKTKIHWEESAGWRRTSGEKEVGGVKTLIQQLTKNAGPLGQLLAGLQEDLDEMMQELTQWRQVNAQLALETKREKELTNELVKPLMKQLEELQQVEYPQEYERVKAARMAVYSNDKKIEELLRSRTK